MIFQENCLLADNSYEISYLIFSKLRKISQILSSAAVVIGALMVKLQFNLQYLTVRWHDYRILTYLILSIVGVCDILVYHHVIRPIGRFKFVIDLRHHASLKPFFFTWPCGTCFKICFNEENSIIVLLNTVIPIIVIVQLAKVT